MASAIANPTNSLQTALAEFQSVLSDQDRQSLQNIKTKPEVDAAIQFTATLDQSNTAKRKGPSISSRLYSVLLSVQQFSNVVDTFVSSNPSIAALVWGAVKLTMLIITNFLTYYEETSKAFLDFGRWCPRFSEYQSLFPTSVRLQAAVCEFHASIVRCCQQIVCMSQRSWKAHLVNSLTQSFQSELETHITLIKDAAREVNFEVQLAKAKSDVEEQQQERQERTLASSHRSALTLFVSKSNTEILEAQRWREIVDRRGKIENDQRRLDAISTFDHVTAFNQARSKRYHSTGVWVFQTPEWRNWQNEDCSSVCWLSGKSSGKTVLSATITDYLLANRRATESISFFFPRFDYAESLLADTIIRSLIRQNLQPDLVDRLSDVISKAHNSFYSPDTMLDLLVSKMAIFSINYLVVDSLDECESRDRQKILQILSFVIQRSSSKVKLFIAGRESVGNEIMDIIPQATRLRMNAPEATADLELFARQTLSERMNMGQLAIGNVVSLESICDMIVHGAQGMFLWVALEIDDICSQACEEDVLVTLQNIPTTLTDMLTRALLRIIAQGSQRIAKEIFKWVCVAKRPLFVDELQVALSIKIGELHSRPERRPEKTGRLSAWCANLVDVDEVSDRVQFVHHSVRTFILDTSITDHQIQEVNEFHSHVDDFDTAVGELCVTYLEWNDFRRVIVPLQSTQSAKPKIFPKPQKILKTALAAEWQGTSAAVINRLIPQPKFDANFHLRARNQDHGENSSSNRHYSLLEYAKKYWVLHTRMLSIGSPIYSSWKQMLKGTHHIASTEWTQSEYIVADTAVLSWAQTHRHFAIIHQLLSAGYLDFERFCEYFCKAGMESRTPKEVQFLVEQSKIFAPRNWTSDMFLPLQIQIVAAAILPEGHFNTLQQTLRRYNSKPHSIARHLLDTNLDIDDIATVPDLLKLTYFASVHLSLAQLMARLLAREHKFCNVPNCMDAQPLHVAVMANDAIAVDMLLNRGANPNQYCRGEGLFTSKSYGFRFSSVLHHAISLATSLRDITVMRRLLAGGADVHFSYPIQPTYPAQCSLGHTNHNNYNHLGITVTKEIKMEIQELHKERNPSSTGQIIQSCQRALEQELTPLQCAVVVSVNETADDLYLEPVNLLLSYGADSNDSISEGLTPIFLAIQYRSVAMVEMLLKAGANPTLACHSGQTAEEYALEIGFHEVRELIRKYHI